ncbi:hypothetical protein RI367_000567 [Sorochytrium milnesiophthora]
MYSSDPSPTNSPKLPLPIAIPLHKPSPHAAAAVDQQALSRRASTLSLSSQLQSQSDLPMSPHSWSILSGWPSAQSPAAAVTPQSPLLGSSTSATVDHIRRNSAPIGVRDIQRIWQASFATSPLLSTVHSPAASSSPVFAWPLSISPPAQAVAATAAAAAAANSRASSLNTLPPSPPVSPNTADVYAARGKWKQEFSAVSMRTQSLASPTTATTTTSIVDPAPASTTASRRDRTRARTQSLSAASSNTVPKRRRANSPMRNYILSGAALDAL